MKFCFLPNNYNLSLETLTKSIYLAANGCFEPDGVLIYLQLLKSLWLSDFFFVVDSLHSAICGAHHKYSCIDIRISYIMRNSMDSRELHLYRVFDGHGRGNFQRNPDNSKHITVISNRHR